MQEKHTAHHIVQIKEPATLKEALSGDYSEQWKEAADAEYQSLQDNDTWELVELPPG